MILYIAFHHDGQDSQPMIGVSDSYDGALKLVKEYDINEDHLNALWLNHCYDDPTEKLQLEWELKREVYKRAYFIDRRELNKFECPISRVHAAWEHQLMDSAGNFFRYEE